MRQQIRGPIKPHRLNVLVNAKSRLNEDPGLTALGRKSIQVPLACAPCQRKPDPKTKRKAYGRQRHYFHENQREC